MRRRMHHCSLEQDQKVSYSLFEAEIQSLHREEFVSEGEVVNTAIHGPRSLLEVRLEGTVI